MLAREPGKDGNNSGSSSGFPPQRPPRHRHLVSPSSSQRQQREFRLLIDAMRASVWFLDRWGRVVDCNQAAREQGPFKDADGCSLLELCQDWDNAAETHREAMQVIRSGTPMLDATEKVWVDGEERWYSVDKIPTKDAVSGVSGLLLVMTDITDRKRYLAELEYQANHDSLTLLPNRNGLYRGMARQLSSRPPHQNMALLLIDLDRF